MCGNRNRKDSNAQEPSLLTATSLLGLSLSLRGGWFRARVGAAKCAHTLLCTGGAPKPEPADEGLPSLSLLQSSLWAAAWPIEFSSSASLPDDDGSLLDSLLELDAMLGTFVCLALTGDNTGTVSLLIKTARLH